jgi:hypothetical protein
MAPGNSNFAPVICVVGCHVGKGYSAVICVAGWLLDGGGGVVALYLERLLGDNIRVSNLSTNM